MFVWGRLKRFGGRLGGLRGPEEDISENLGGFPELGIPFRCSL